MTARLRPEAFECPQCAALLMPPVCCCGRGHPLILQCPDCGWIGRGTVTPRQSTRLELPLQR